MALLLFAVAAAQGGKGGRTAPGPALPDNPAQVWDLSSTSLASFHGYNYAANWTLRANTECPKAHLGPEDVGDLLCSACPTCPGYIPAQDAAGSPAACGTLPELLTKCSELDACHSVSWLSGVKNGGRGYLNGFACAADGAQVREMRVTLYIKTLSLPEDLADCPLGKAAELTTTSYPSIAGLYEMTGFGVFSQMDGDARVVWHNSQCGWVVEKSLFTPIPPTVSPPGCSDDDEAAAALFGQEEYANTCQTAAHWGTSYCAHPVFAAVCPASCGVACSRRLRDEAVDALRPGAGATCATVGCDDHVAARICALECPGERRLLPLHAPAHLRRSLQDHGRPAARALGSTAGLKYEEVYRTFAVPVCDRIPPDNALLTATSLFDVKAFHTALVPRRADHVCPAGEETYTTYKDEYCSNNNIPVRYYTYSPSDIGQSRQLQSIPSYFVYGTGYCPTGQQLSLPPGATFTTATDCAALCSADPRCKYFSFISGGTGRNILLECILSTGAGHLGGGECFDRQCSFEEADAGGDGVCNLGNNRQGSCKNACGAGSYVTYEHVFFERAPTPAPTPKPTPPTPAPTPAWDSIGSNACVEKCGSRTTDSQDGPGNDYCSGNSGTFVELTEALCLPRESCEELCSMLGDLCSSFDMHRALPRCYLNKPTCDALTPSTSTDYDRVVKALTPNEDEGGAVDDGLRDRWITYTGVNCTASDTSGLMAMSRADCETKCSRNANCTGFELTEVAGTGGDSSNCELIFGGCFDSLDYLSKDNGHVEIVKKVPHETCYVDLAFETAEMDFSGRYLKQELLSGEIYLHPNNKTHLHFEVGNPAVPKRPRCDDWFLEVNTAPPISVTIFNCSDAPADVVNLFFRFNFTEVTDPFMTYREKVWEFPCQTGHDMGLCSQDLFYSLCPHTCVSFDHIIIGEKPYTTQDTDIYTFGGTVFGSCRGDNDYAAFALMAKLFHQLDPVNLTATPVPDFVLGACMNASYGDVHMDGLHAGAVWRNSSMNPCTSFEWSPLLAWYCPETCPLYPQIPSPPPPGTFSDEASPQGATHLNRQLADAHTVSLGGKRSAAKEVTYLDGLANETLWYPVFRTFANGSDDNHSLYSGASLNAAGEFDEEGQVCKIGNATIGDKFMFKLLDRIAHGLYPTKIPVDSAAKLEYVCKQAAPCPAYTSCALALGRMKNEMEVLYDGADKTAIGTSVPASFLDVDRYSPKALLSESRSTAVLSGMAKKFLLTPKLFRTAPGAPSVEITDFGAADTSPFTFVLTVVSPLAADGYYAESELGRDYAQQPGFGPWVSDVIRVQKFDQKTGALAAGVATLKVYLGAMESPENLRLFIVRPGQEPEMLVSYDLTIPRITTAGREEPSGFFSFQIPEMNADYVAAVAVNECLSSPCAENAICTDGPIGTEVPELYTCECMAGYDGDGYSQCSLKPDAYASYVAPQFVRITPESSLDHGWRVYEILLYSDEKCSDLLLFGSVGEALPEPADSAKDATWLTITSQTKVNTGPLGSGAFAYSHYPHPQDDGRRNPKYWNGNLFDEASTSASWSTASLQTQWWSECLQCEPEDAVIEFAIKSNVMLGCVRVVQDPTHLAKGVKVEWGPLAGPGCGLLPGQPRCPSTMIYAQRGGMDIMVPTTCGQKNTQIFGEILQVASWEGSYTNVVPVESECACHRLCVLHIAQGCRTYKFLDTALYVQGAEFANSRNPQFMKHCYLQTDAFESGTGFYGIQEAADFTGYTSGRVAERYVKNGKLSVLPFVLSVAAEPLAAVGTGKPFTLMVTGAGMPYTSDAKTDGSPMQRVKLVASGEPCTAPLPKEVSGLYCVESPGRSGPVTTLCGPAPTGVSATMAAFANVVIDAAETDRAYDVCYCPRDCSDLTRWQKAPTALAVPASVLKWASTPAVVYRESDVTVTVTAPVGVAFTTNENWELKLVREWYSCDVEMDTSLFTAVEYIPGPPETADPLVAPGAAASYTDTTGVLRKRPGNAASDQYYYYQPYRGGGFVAPTPTPTYIRIVEYGALGSATAYGTRDCNGPDECAWTFQLTVPLSDVGAYTVCFRQDASSEWKSIPSLSGLSRIDVLALADDRARARGVFHNQDFSARAGAVASTQKLAGTRLDVPTAAAVLATKGACGDLGAFAFDGALLAAAKDTTPPSVVAGSSNLGNTIDGDNADAAAHVISVAFSEAVTTDGCSGSFYLYASTSSTPKVTVNCRNVTLVSGNKILITPGIDATWHGGGTTTYYLVIEAGAVSDIAGNVMPLYKGTADLTVGNAVATVTLYPDLISVDVAATDPAPGTTASFDTIALYFTELVHKPAAAHLTALGISSALQIEILSEGALIEAFFYDEVTVASNVITITPSAAVMDNKIYTVKVPYAFVAWGSSPGGTPPVNSAFEFVLEKASSGFVATDHVIFMDGATSTADALKFSFAVSDGAAPGRYSLCFCSGQEDTTLVDLGDGDTTYIRATGIMAYADPAWLDGVDTALTVLGKPIKDHECIAKCDKGCLGPDCYCEGYFAGAAEADALCLPEHLCASACDLIAECKGFDTVDIYPLCYLGIATNATDVTDGSLQHFMKNAGTACTHFSDFDEKVGSLAISTRVDVGVDYVFTPGENGSFEVTGTGLMGGVGGLSADRIMVIDCSGRCGIAPPTKSTDLPLASWAAFKPTTFFQDAAAEDAENPAKAAETVTVEPYPTGYGYYGGPGGTLDGYYCKGLNLDIVDYAVPSDGIMRPLAEFGCYQKCSVACEGDHCFCDGYMSGYDMPSSNAICADEDTCKYLCDSLDDCKSIDRSKSSNRCFLNSDGCDFHVDKLERDPTYALIIKRLDPNEDISASSRRLTEERVERRAAATLLPALDLGFSWPAMLRFAPVRFLSGGTFKLCFCDSTLLPAGKQCATPADFLIEAGTVHASGLSCLIGKPELQRAACVPQYHGGLRCYQAGTAPMPAFPKLQVPAPGGAAADEYEAALSTYCLYQPEEVGCQAVAGFQSGVAG